MGPHLVASNEQELTMASTSRQPAFRTEESARLIRDALDRCTDVCDVDLVSVDGGFCVDGFDRQGNKFTAVGNVRLANVKDAGNLVAPDHGGVEIRYFRDPAQAHDPLAGEAIHSNPPDNSQSEA